MSSGISQENTGFEKLIQMQPDQGVTSKVKREEESYPTDPSPKLNEEKSESAEVTQLNHLGNTLGNSSNATILEENDDDDSDDVQIIENPESQLVIYNPMGNCVVQEEQVTEHINYIPPPFTTYAPITPRVLPSIGAFTVQCAECFKWRLIPTKEKYEEIRESILQQPFVCERAREWRSNICCDDPPDISQDGSRLWAIDKPNISQPPPGWERILRIRGEGSYKFADVYYATPSGKRLRSMVEVRKYLLEHPEYITEDLSLSQFSFQTPKPLQEDYVRKRPRMATPLEPAEVNPLSWVGPSSEPVLQLGQPGMSVSHVEDSVSHTMATPSKRKAAGSSSKHKATKLPLKHMYDGETTYVQPEIKVERLQQHSPFGL